MRSARDDNGRGALRVSLLVVILAVSGTSAPSWGRSLKQELTPTGVDADARGKAAVVVAHQTHGRLKVQARRLASAARYEVVLDGVRIGTLQTNRGGNGVANFSTKPKGRTQRLGADPRGKLLEVRDADGDDVLLSEMPRDSESEGKVRCCMAEGEDDDDEEEVQSAECEATTPEECLAEGGVEMGEGTCLPNPCGTVTSEAVACCTPQDDEDGPECEISTEAECAAEHGTSVGSSTCEPNPCAPVSPPEERIACCVPEEDDGQVEIECESVTAGVCAVLGGTVSVTPTCGPDACVL